MNEIERAVIVTALVALSITTVIAFITDHILDMEVDIEINNSYLLVGVINVCKIVINASIVALTAFGLTKLVVWLWGLIP